jgi:hypothetical protein
VEPPRSSSSSSAPTRPSSVVRRPFSPRSASLRCLACASSVSCLSFHNEAAHCRIRKSPGSHESIMSKQANNNGGGGMAIDDDVDPLDPPPVAEVTKKASAEEESSLVHEGTDSDEDASSTGTDPPVAVAAADAAAAAAAKSSSPSPSRHRLRRRKHSLEERERRVQSSYKKMKREAERTHGVDSVGRRNPPVPREATPVPNVYRYPPLPPMAAAATWVPGSASSAPPAFANHSRGAYEGTVFRGGGGGGRSHGAAADPRLRYQGLSFGGAKGKRGNGLSSSLKPPPPPAPPSDPSLGYSGVAFRRPNDRLQGADPRFHIFDLNETPGAGVPAVSVRKVATETMTYVRPGLADDRHASHAPRGRTAAARRLSFDRDPRQPGNPSRHRHAPLQAEDDDNEQGHIPFEREEGNVNQRTTKKAKKAKASWEDVLDRDFDAFPHGAGSSTWARRAGRAIGPAVRGVVTAAAKGLGFVWWWIAMAALAEYLVHNVVVPDAYYGRALQGPPPLLSSSSPVLAPVVQHIAPWIRYHRPGSSSSSNQSVFTSHPVAALVTESFADFGPLPRSFLYASKPTAPSAAPSSDTQKKPTPSDDETWLATWRAIWNGQWLCKYTLCTAPMVEDAGDYGSDDDDGGGETRSTTSVAVREVVDKRQGVGEEAYDTEAVPDDNHYDAVDATVGSVLVDSAEDAPN